MKYIVIFLILSIGFSSCIQDPIIEEESPEDIPSNRPLLDTLWTAELFTTPTYTANEYLYLQDGYLYVVMSTHFDGHEGFLGKIDISNGNVEYTRSMQNLNNSSRKFYDDRLLVKDREVISAFKLDDGRLYERIVIGDDTQTEGYFSDNYAYYSEQVSKNKINNLYRVPYNNISRPSHIYTLNNSVSPGRNKSIESVTEYIDPNTGNEMIAFQHSMYRYDLGGRTDIVFYDITEKKIVKLYPNIDKFGEAPKSQMYIIDEKIYFLGSNNIICFDLNNHDILWNKSYSDKNHPIFGFLSELVYAEDRNLLILKDEGTGLLALNADDGSIRWHNQESGANGNPITYHKGYIYYVKDGLQIFDAYNGELVTRKISPLNFDRRFNYYCNVVIDETKELMFILGGTHIFCAKLLPEKE